jgi:hypothetical protein
MQAGPRIPLGAQLYEAEVGPASGPPRRLSHLGGERRAGEELGVGLEPADGTLGDTRCVTFEKQLPNMENNMIGKLV